MNNLVKTMINRMSVSTGTVITDKHLSILEYAYAYYEKNRVGPLYQNIKKQTGATRENIEQLFPYGLNSVYTWVGIPIHSADSLCKPLASVDVDQVRQVYLDYNATTPLRKEVVTCLTDYYQSETDFGNPSSSTHLGKKAHDLVAIARSDIAACLNVSPSEIIFTSGGSESNNLAIKGLAFQHLNQKGHIVSSKTEHPAALQTLKFLEQLGFAVTYLDVDQDGRVCPKAVQRHLRKETILVSIMAANNEIGVINPIAEIGQICRSAGIPLMVDAVQAFGKLPLHPKEMGISLLSASAHKIYGPKGIGALFVDDAVTLTPLIHGGGQEFGLRAGTENVGSTIAFGKAARLSLAELSQEDHRLSNLQSFFLTELKNVAPDAIINGSLTHRLPNNLNVGFPNIDSGSLLLSLNQIGIYVSAGSACSAGSKEVSHVIKALGVDTDKYGIVRFSFGLNTTKSDLEYLFRYLPAILKQL